VYGVVNQSFSITHSGYLNDVRRDAKA
jgi:hypothetical protein